MIVKAKMRKIRLSPFRFVVIIFWLSFARLLFRAVLVESDALAYPFQGDLPNAFELLRR